MTTPVCVTLDYSTSLAIRHAAFQTRFLINSFKNIEVCSAAVGTGAAEEQQSAELDDALALTRFLPTHFSVPRQTQPKVDEVHGGLD